VRYLLQTHVRMDLLTATDTASHAPRDLGEVRPTDVFSRSKATLSPGLQQTHAARDWAWLESDSLTMTG
jgi:hypothetical protein